MLAAGKNLSFPRHVSALQAHLSALPAASWHRNASVHTHAYVNPSASFTLHPGAFDLFQLEKRARRASSMALAVYAAFISLSHVIDLPAFLEPLISIARTNQSWRCDESKEKKIEMWPDCVTLFFSCGHDQEFNGYWNWYKNSHQEQKFKFVNL